ncbi:hypothetical protein [Rhodococcus sp. NPDC049939]|uniref:hypothetical protein n=1 Tax=Rhodococcus sp. NPDC049939 TaxID=3155511 RepID=UPI0033D34A85
MIKSARAAATAALAAPLLAAVFAAPANAAPEDVTLAAEVQGNNVDFTLTNNSQQRLSCSVNVAPAATPWNAVWDHNPLPSPGSDDRFTATLDDGSYQVDWFCHDSDISESWGTGNIGNFTKTAEPIFFTAPVVPDDGGTGDGDTGDGDGDGGTGDGWHLAPGSLAVLEALTAGSAALGSS